MTRTRKQLHRHAYLECKSALLRQSESSASAAITTTAPAARTKPGCRRIKQAFVRACLNPVLHGQPSRQFARNRPRHCHTLEAPPMSCLRCINNQLVHDVVDNLSRMREHLDPEDIHKMSPASARFCTRPSRCSWVQYIIDCTTRRITR